VKITGENKILDYIAQSVNADMFVNFTVGELFFEDLPINIPMTVSKNDTIQSTIPKLAETLDSFSDDLVVLENNTPIGFIGGYEVLKAIFENPTFEFIKNTSIEILKLVKNQELSKKELIKILKENNTISSQDGETLSKPAEHGQLKTILQPLFNAKQIETETRGRQSFVKITQKGKTALSVFR